MGLEVYNSDKTKKNLELNWSGVDAINIACQIAGIEEILPYVNDPITLDLSKAGESILNKLEANDEYFKSEYLQWTKEQCLKHGWKYNSDERLCWLKKQAEIMKEIKNGVVK